MAGRKKMDPISEAAMEAVVMERQQGELRIQEQAMRERRIAEYYQAIGQVKTANMFAEFASVSALVWIQQMRESKAYKDIGTWESFCESIGYSRQHIEDQLKSLTVLGEKFLQTVCGLGVGYRDLRRLRQLTHEGALNIEDGVLVIGDEEIPLDAEHRDDLQSAMERLLDAKEQVISEKAATLRAKDKLLKSKADLIERQEKALAVYEGQAEKKGLTADEEAFIQKCGNARLTIDGFLMQFDPDRDIFPTSPTPRMKAALMETLGYLRRAIVAAHDTAGDVYGDAEMDSPGWIQPNLREAGTELGDSLAAARERHHGGKGE